MKKKDKKKKDASSSSAKKGNIFSNLKGDDSEEEESWKRGIVKPFSFYFTHILKEKKSIFIYIYKFLKKWAKIYDFTLY